ncbi:Protein argonaute 1 [Zea mays]|uniref:Protein argonaute 1 n=2 Tax=Zea mays TaxID=4577 RepID=A0A1D6IAA8_MAIZE|nr:Protein argonaute 1 [Zea mays]
MASHQRGGGRDQANPNVFQGNRRNGNKSGGRGSGRGGGRGGQGGGRGGYAYGYQGGSDYGRGRGHGGPQTPGPDDVRQAEAGPSLAERNAAAAAAALREKFKTMDIVRDEPMFPARPGLGAVGTPCGVRANHFFVGLVDKGLHQYDVTISPDTTPKGMYREIMSKLVSENRQTELGGRLPAYDGRKLLFSAGELPFETMEFVVTLSGRTERMYKVVIKHTTGISLQQLFMLLAGYPSDIPAQALQVLDIVLRDIILNERNSMEYVAVGRSFFSPRGPRDIGMGVEGWTGFYQSIRPTQNGLSVIIDISSTAFIRPLPLIDYVMLILGKDRRTFTSITPMDLVLLNKALKGLRIEVTHRGAARPKYRIASLKNSPSLQFFQSSAGVEKSVADYFRETYQLEMDYDFLPCLQVGNDQRPNYLPMEVCRIVAGQKNRKKLDAKQVSNLANLTCQSPDTREKKIRQFVERNAYSRAERAIEFGMEVDYCPTSVQARVLPAPTLKYRETERECLCYPTDGLWNMKNKLVVDGARVGNWACVNFCRGLNDSVVDKFCSDLVTWCRTSGVRMDGLTLPIYRAQPEQVEDELTRFYQNMLVRGQKIDLLLAILPEKNGSLYGNFKRICDTQIGVMSQCCLDKNIRNAKLPYFANVAIKINAKFGGRNLEFANPEESLPFFSTEPTIMFGADVTHPAALDDTSPSIASVVASQDWPKVANYNGIIRAQGHRQELIDGLENIVKELLLAFVERSKQRPKQLIFYRDGVSESQFKQVLEQEIHEIEKAWTALYNEKPKITFVVVQKRHHTRLFPSNSQYEDKSGNIRAGTVVDNNICHPTEFDFFLCSHAGAKGTSRPAHYHVLRDDNKFTADALQSLTYNLCYMYSCCTRSVSIAPPAYYAHKLASRARFYANQASNAAAGPQPLPEVKDELKRRMFYC